MIATKTRTPRGGKGEAGLPNPAPKVPASPEVEAADTKQAKLLAQDKAKADAKVMAEVGGAVAKMVGKRNDDEVVASLAREEQRKAEDVLNIVDDNEAATKGHKPTMTSVHRITDEWTSAKGKDVAVKDRVKTGDGVVLDVVGRWTRKGKTGNVPMVTGHIVTLPTDAMVGKDKGIGDRHNAVAAEVAHTK